MISTVKPSMCKSFFTYGSFISFEVSIVLSSMSVAKVEIRFNWLCSDIRERVQWIDSQ
jgi:hypothetical protein